LSASSARPGRRRLSGRLPRGDGLRAAGRLRLDRLGVRTPADLHAHSLTDLLTDPGTICRNQLRIGTSEHTFARLTNPTPLQARALDLLDIQLHT
jgi:hypothetical protein